MQLKVPVFPSIVRVLALPVDGTHVIGSGPVVVGSLGLRGPVVVPFSFSGTVNA